MTLAPLDWIIIAAYFVASAIVGIWYAKRGGRSVTDYFLTGRSLPWWLAGTSMVATTFAADTPLAVAGLVARNGIAGNWIWWSAAFGSMLTVFFFARLWRRAGILTDVEFAELRYSGRPAALLRGFRALYLGIPINCVIMGWVNLAMAKILAVTLGWDRLTAVLLSLAITGIYSAISGLWGVVVTDFFQFVFAMAGTIALAWFALQLPQIGGLDGLVAQVPPGTLSFTPFVDSSLASTGITVVALPLASFLTYVCVQWWASWYPGQEPGGGGYVAQRMMSAKDERHSFLATLWFTVAHYCVRPWPWIIVGLVSVVLYPTIEDKEAGYVMVMRDHLPIGWRGLLLGAFFAAYMSTISTQLNWGTSYVVNDFYRRFVKRDADEQHYVWISRITTLALMVLSAIVTFYLESIRQAWEFVLESGAGIGLVLILRWYWWRINAWSEISAMVAAAVGYAALKIFTTIAFPYTLLIVVAWTTVCWLVVTMLTAPESEAHLIAFYRRTRPDGPGWSRIAKAAGVKSQGGIAGLAIDWIAGVILVYAVLFGASHSRRPQGASSMST
jgi:SSS family solute:Na+ symporter